MSLPPAIANGGGAVTDSISAAVVPLLVSATFLGLLVPVASTLPKLIVAGAALSVVGVGGGLVPNAITRLYAFTVPIPVAKSQPVCVPYAG